MRRSILFLTSAAHCVNHMFWESVGPLLPFLIVAFDLTHTQAGKLGFVYSITYGLLNYPAGHWSDRYGRRIFILLFLLVASSATFMIALSKTHTQLFFLFAIAGIGGGLYHPPGTALLSNAYPENMRGRAMGLHASGGAVGIVLAYAIIGGVASIWNWKAALVCLSGIGFLLALVYRTLFWHVDENVFEAEQAEPSENSTPVSIWTMIKWMPLMMAFYGFAIFLFKGAYVWVPTFLKETYGFSPSKAIVFSAILPGIGIFSNYLMGKFSDHFGRRFGLVLVFSILGLCFFFLYLGFQPILIPLLIVLGFFLNSFSGIINAYTGDYMPPQVMGKAFGMVFTFSICVSSFAPYIMGVISDRSSLAMSMAFLGAVSFVGAVVALKKPNRITVD